MVDEGWVELKGVWRAPSEPEHLGGWGSQWDRQTYLAIAGTALESSRPRVHLDRGLIRSVEHNYSLSDFDSARINGDLIREGTLELIFGKVHEFEWSVELRKGDFITVSPRTQELLPKIFAKTSIAIPTDRWDPKGKFARSGSPLNVTRDEAVALVTNPPLHGEKLPITF